MFNRNIGSKERIARMVAGALMILCGLAGLHATPLGLIVAGAGVASLLTGLIRYCPACALAGRKRGDNC